MKTIQHNEKWQSKNFYNVIARMATVRHKAPKMVIIRDYTANGSALHNQRLTNH